MNSQWSALQCKVLCDRSSAKEFRVPTAFYLELYYILIITNTFETVLDKFEITAEFTALEIKNVVKFTRITVRTEES